jgi:alpha-galactosidase
MSNRIVLIGAGSAMFGLGTLGDIFKEAVLEGSTIVLHDINPQTLKLTQREAQSFLDDKDLEFTLEATTDRKEAVRGADFCIISIEVGDRYALWEQDWKVPLQFGIHQVYGENGGPGGFFHAMRIIPPILEICADIAALAPDALVMNLSNPMIRISHAVNSAYPDLQYVGLCHEIASLAHHLPLLLGIPLNNLLIKAGGLNHFSVLVEAKRKDTGHDLYPQIRDKGPKYFREAENYFGNQGERDLCVEILERFGVLPNTTDSHFGEYIHWAYDSVDHQGILGFYADYKKAMLLPPLPPQERLGIGSGEGELWGIVPIISAIVSGREHAELAVNLRNDGLIDLLPDEMPVEVPGRIRDGELRGIPLNPFPPGFGALLQNQVGTTLLTTEAIQSCSKVVAKQALLADPVFNRSKVLDDLLETMIHLQRPYLDYLQ